MCRLHCCSGDAPAVVVTSPKVHPRPHASDRSETLPSGYDHAPKRS